MKHWRILTLLATLGAVPLTTWGTGLPVFDAGNWVVNLTTQVNTLKSTLNEATMIANQAKDLEYQAQGLYNQAMNLKANPLQLLGQIQGLWGGYNAIMGNAEGLAFGVQQAAARFEVEYPALASSSVQEITQRSAAMLTSIRAASVAAISSQSIYERLCQQLAGSQQALTAAQASQGALQIAQAQAQMQGLANEQLATLSQLEAANGRVQTEWIAMQVKEKVDGMAVNERYFESWGAQGFKGIGESQGVKLPYRGPRCRQQAPAFWGNSSMSSCSRSVVAMPGRSATF